MSDAIKNPEISLIKNRSIVSLKIDKASIDEASQRIELAKPLVYNEFEERILWLGPKHWLLVSEKVDSQMVIEKYTDKLTGLNFNLTDQSSGISIIRLPGFCCREILSMGSGLDYRTSKFSVGACCTINLARISVTIIAINSELLELYLDSSYETYLMNWLLDSNRIKDLVASKNNPMSLEALS